MRKRTGAFLAAMRLLFFFAWAEPFGFAQGNQGKQAAPLPAQTWQPVGPPGGDIRSLAADPNDNRVIYMGTSDGHVFTSRDGGDSWSLLSRVGERQDTVVMYLLVHARDSRIIYAGTWTLGGIGGGVYRSDDRGRSWRYMGLDGLTVRMLAQSSTEPQTLVAATVQGVYRSTNAGKNWELITPTNHDDLRNFDSVAIDPRDAQAIYAGTYHLAWKTLDGGRNWVPIHRGMIDDSDVMHLGIDRQNPDRIFATACSGMYRSENRGELWAKIQGIPATARRTHFLQQDPQQPQTLYAGTTQGLWKSIDDGTSWKRMTPAQWSLIGLVLDGKRPGRLVVGIERQGIQISEDGGNTFRASNRGFYHQQVVSFGVDPQRPERMLVVLTNQTSPVLVTHDGGSTWSPLASNLRIEQLRRVYGTPAGWWASLQGGGLLRYDEKKSSWVRTGAVKVNVATPKPAPSKAPAKSRKPQRVPAEAARPLNEVVYDLGFSRELWLAATEHGVLASRDQGATWTQFAPASLGTSPAHALHVSADGSEISVLAPRALFSSSDAGSTWAHQNVGFENSGVLRLHVVDANTLAVTSSRGMFISRDAGQHWGQANLPELVISDFAFAEGIFVASTQSRGLYLSHDRGKTWEPMEERGAEARFLFLKRLGESATVLAASSTEGLHALQVGALRARAQQTMAPATSPQR